MGSGVRGRHAGSPSGPSWPIVRRCGRRAPRQPGGGTVARIGNNLSSR
ncbi:hypothetical protein UO65_0679 [Actinokineospora spheciospongiae]|uniref:Uncharacterized protein n=1 Tax=Actinokineospora spheciospongiae TaxID=909613 RepID=W7IUC2_9PSEU|nr:hypothetical protein UO65_0679 [Actinokineospora spheciospongiae]